MAKEDKQTGKSAADIKFEAAVLAAKAQEVFLDRPIVNPDSLKDAFEPITGYLVCRVELNLPAGAAKRPDGKETWGAYVLHLTQPTKAMDGDKIIPVVAGREVYIAANAAIKELDGLLGQNVMYELILGDGGLKDLGRGKNPMRMWRVAETKRTLVRTGMFSIGGPSSVPQLGQGNLGQVVSQINGAAATL